MFRRVASALALVSALTGCAGTRNGPFVEYHEGQAPETRQVTREATYELRTNEQPSVVLAETHVVKGERIGFRREEDGSVSAVGPGYTRAVLPGGYAWVMVPGSTLAWHERVWRDANGPLHAAKEATWFTICACGVLIAGAAVLVMYVKSGTH